VAGHASEFRIEESLSRLDDLDMHRKPVPPPPGNRFVTPMRPASWPQTAAVVLMSWSRDELESAWPPESTEPLPADMGSVGPLHGSPTAWNATSA
jgi:hypothetical protein